MVNHETNELFFDDFEVPVENLIGEEGLGFTYILDGMNAERILIAAECIGDGYWFTDRARRYAGERVVFDRPIGQNQGIQFPIAQAYAQPRGRPDALRRRGCSTTAAVRRRGQSGEAARGRCVVAGRQRLPADPRRLRLRG
jgi:acyl-CoA dehydrogenase